MASHAQGVEHVGLTNPDRFMLCAQEVFGKPVLREAEPLGRAVESVSCPASKDEIRKGLEGHQESVLDVRLFELKDWVFLEPEYRLKPEPPYGRWKKLEIVPEVRNWAGIPDSRALTPEELAEASRIVFEKARVSPLLAAIVEPGADGETATVKVPLVFDAHRLASHSVTESVVAISKATENGGTGRLIYGEIREGKYVPLWDSPLFGALNLQLGYVDLDGDGIKEILLFSDGGRYPGELEALTAFDTRGHEVTRQGGHCWIQGFAEIDQHEIVCPLMGEGFEMKTEDKGRTAIFSMAKNPDNEDGPPVPRAYRLVDGFYRDAGTAKKE